MEKRKKDIANSSINDDIPPPRVRWDYGGDVEMEDEWIEEHLREIEEDNTRKEEERRRAEEWLKWDNENILAITDSRKTKK